jgi:hypothetical protein
VILRCTGRRILPKDDPLIAELREILADIGDE